MKAQCERCKEIVPLSFVLADGGITVSCPACQASYFVPSSIPTPTPTTTPKPGSPSPTPKSATTWAEGAAASARAADFDDTPGAPAEEPGDILEGGDILYHPTFGRCEVLRLEGDAFVRIRLASGRHVRLAIELLRLTPQPREGGKRSFRARIDQ